MRLLDVYKRQGYINHGSKRGIGYLMEATVDCKHGILTGVDAVSYTHLDVYKRQV